MPLLARAPCLAARSTRRSNVLVQFRGMHGECEVDVSHRNPPFRAESYETSGATFNYGKKVPFATETFLYPLALSPVDTQTNGFICSSGGGLCI